MPARALRSVGGVAAVSLAKILENKMGGFIVSKL
jgi:hypothetical protein